MPKPFLQVADVSKATANALDHYPLLDGPLRELIQNSDDAGATKQLFVLDHRIHPISSLASLHYITSQQSPALVACNDAYFDQKDWNSVRNIFDSSKYGDPGTFGQFGQGFRCVYHLTDCPQIFSGNTLALLDLPEGIILDTADPSDARYTSHFSAFQGLPNISCYMPPASGSRRKGKGKQDPPRLDGTAIRLPLRSRSSSVSTSCPKPEDILKLFHEFTSHDLECILLFLNNVREIAIYEVTPNGDVRELCTAVARGQDSLIGDGYERGIGLNSGENFDTWRATVETRVSLSPGSIKTTQTTWRFIDCAFADESSAGILGCLSKEYKPEEEMKRRKLNQRVRLATPLSIVVSLTSSPLTTIVPSSPKPVDKSSRAAAKHGVSRWRSGRMFNGLPLPRANNQGWPIHVDARFAIPPSRQSIRPVLEGGFVGEWNSILFVAFIPQAWTFLLNVLAHEDRVKDVFEYWPPHGVTYNYTSPIATAGVRSDLVGASGSASSKGATKPSGMLQMVFDCVVVAKAAVWPIYVACYPHASPKSTSRPSVGGLTSQTPVPIPSLPGFSELGSLKVARENIHFPDLRNALAECGIRFTKPPLYFVELVERCTSRHLSFLEPGSVYEQLLNNISRLEKVVGERDEHAAAILDFLIQGKDIRLLAGLPLLKNVAGRYIALQHSDLTTSPATKHNIHTILDAHSAPIFKAFDPNAISLQDIKHVHAPFIRENAPGTLNVMELTPQKIAEYLSTDIRWTSSSLSSTVSNPTSQAETVQWLSKFYTWLSGRGYAEKFFGLAEVQQLYLIPTHCGLKRVDDLAFDSARVTPALGKCLHALGISILDFAAGPAVRKLLVDAANILKNVEDIHALLKGFRLGTPPDVTESTASLSTSRGLTCSEWRVLIDHIVRHSKAEELSPPERRILQALPIYPILPSDSLISPLPTPSPGPVPDNQFVYAINSIEILPIVDACVLLDFRGWPTRSHEVLRLLSSSNARFLLPAEVFELGVQNFGSQPPEKRASIVKFAAKNERTISRENLEKLLDQPSIACKDGVVRKPGEVIDPTSDSDISNIVSLCSDMDTGSTTFDKYLPRLDGRSDLEMMQEYKKFPTSPFKDNLDQSVLLKVTSTISSNIGRPESLEVSRKLFKVLTSNPTYGDFVRAIPREDRWIATNLGLKATHECRDRNFSSALFDEVYALVDDAISMTDSLRTIMGWSQEIPLKTLFLQLDTTLKKGGKTFARVRDIVKTIGSAEISETEFDQLRATLGDRPWVPTKAGALVRPRDAVLDFAVDEAGFFEVSFNEVAHPKVIEFLRTMGVEKRPTTNAIIARIQEMAVTQVESNEFLNASEIASVVKLLECLSDDFSLETNTQVLVPDTDGLLRVVSELYFNDTGISIQLPVSERSSKAIAHDLLPESLARRLGIEPLANSYSRFSGYMGESFISSIRNVIAEYTETQTLVEMIANAADAGAKRFIVIVDELPQPCDHLISPNLSVFQECPALLVYNDARFTDEDFEGLCNTGEGSKKNDGSAIGQFGRGVLTMFHFTEFPMLVSSTTAMFIDPSRQHLPDLPQNANNQRMDIENLQRYHPDHISFLNTLGELLDFESGNATGFGTAFRLPLRLPEHINSNSISTQVWSISHVKERIISAFYAIARDCFLFTGLECIQAYARTPAGTLQALWSFEGTRIDVKIDGDFQQSTVEISENHFQQQRWQTVSYIVPDDVVPEFVPSLSKAHGRSLKQPKVSLAALIDPNGTDYLDYHERNVLFSTLPLTEATYLPVRCSAAFITTSDRRHMRLQLDNDSGYQAQYNEWLLKDVIPPAYLYLLSSLLEIGVPNDHFWPVSGRTPADRIIIDSLYENYLKTTDRPLFQSAFDIECQLTPEEVVILDQSSSIQAVITFLSPPNVAIYSEPLLSWVTGDAELPQVSPQFVRDQILLNPAFTSAFKPSSDSEQPQLTIDDLACLLEFFLNNNQPEQLLDLPLLPLEDGSLGIFAQGPQHPVYYVWKNHSIPNETFANPHRLVKLDFNAEMLLDKGFNIEELCSASLASLIEERFPKRHFLDVRQHPEMHQFIDDFWENFHLLGLELKDIEDFPLVPKLFTTEYISLRVCKEGEIPIIPARVDGLSCQCLVTLGVPLVQLSTPPCPPPLNRILRNHSLFPTFHMKDILLALENLDPERLNDAFLEELTDEDRSNFSEWARMQLFADIPNDLRATAQVLPVWKACDSSGMHDYVCASELILLPENLDESIVAPYISEERKVVVIPQDRTDLLRSILRRQLGVPEISFHELLRIVNSGLPPTMPDIDRRSEYKELVKAILERAESHDAFVELQLPNAFDSTLCSVQELYSREEPLFRTVYPAQSPKFAAPEFQDIEGQLGHLKRMEDLTMTIFADCVQCISDGSNMEGASIAFDVMNDRLPVLLGSLGPDADHWELIEDLAFIPKTDRALERWGRGNTGLDVAPYLQRPFDDLVAPRDIVRAEYVAVAWSQRVLPARNLSEGLVRAYPDLGRPSATEVIDHLRVLVTRVADDYPGHPAVVSDIEATYHYLNERAEELTARLSEIGGESLFLNVDDPREAGAGWTWDPATRISFDVRDVGNFRYARRFLQRYRFLLVAAGAQEVNHPSMNRTPAIPGGSHALSRIRERYTWMRQARHLVDVKFVARDDDPNDPLLCHRSFLATHSNHLMVTFCSGFRETHPASAESPIIIAVPDYSRQCIAFVLDYVYTGNLGEAVPLEVILDALRLAKYWEMEELVETIQEDIVSRWMHPDTLPRIERVAEREDFGRLSRAVSVYRRGNQSYINRA